MTPEDARFDIDGITSLAVNLASTLAVVGGTSALLHVVSVSKSEVVGALGGHTEGDGVRVRHGYTAGRDFPHRTRNRCGYIPYPYLHGVRAVSHETHGKLIINIITM